MHQLVLMINGALGYDFNTLEFAIRDGSTPPSYRAWLGAPTEFTDVIPTYAAFRAQQDQT